MFDSGAFHETRRANSVRDREEADKRASTVATSKARQQIAEDALRDLDKRVSALAESEARHKMTIKGLRDVLVGEKKINIKLNARIESYASRTKRLVARIEEFEGL